MSQAGSLNSSGGGSGSVQTLTGNTGGPVGPTANNINIIGSGAITVTGNPGTSTLTISSSGGTGVSSVTGTANQILASPTTGAVDLSLIGPYTPATYTTHGVLIGEGTSSIVATAVGATGTVLAGNTGADPTFQTIATIGGITTITGNSGGAESPSSGNFNILGTGSITVAGSANTETVQLTGLTNHNVQVGAGTATLTQVPPSATSGIPLVSNGSSSNPSFTTALVAGGGTGATTFNTNGVIISNTTNTGSLTARSLSDGQIVIGSSIGTPLSANITAGTGISVTNGHNSITITNTSTGVTTIDGDSGFASGSTITFNANSNSGSSVQFSGDNASTIDLLVTDPSMNTIIGNGAGNRSITGTNNVGLGGTFQSLSTGSLNVSIGDGSSPLIDSGSSNVAVGYNVFNTLAGGGQNVGIGQGSLGQITTGSTNIAIGYLSGNSITAGDSNNILIGDSGVSGESNVFRLGSASGTSKAYVQGISNSTYSAGSPVPYLTYCDSANAQVVSPLPVASSSATSTFGSLVVGTARQNTASYAILVNVSIVVTAATGATITLGIGPTSTPTTNTAVTTFTAAAATTFHLCGFVPSGYYMLVNTTGTITVGSITTQTCAVG